jgi:glycosyltransferase involved in cell wall biosynthesis
VSKVKGVDLLITAFAGMDRRDTELVIVGAAGDVPIVGGESQGIVWKGRLSHLELLKEYHAADVLVLPSRFDGLAQVVLEAMHTGLPAIVSTTVGARDFIEDGLNGWVFEAGCAEALRACMQTVRQSRSTLSEAGYRSYLAANQMDWALYRSRIAERFRDLDVKREPWPAGHSSARFEQR